MLNQDDTPLLYSLVFGEGVVNDATSVVLFNALQRFDLSHVTSGDALQFSSSLLYLFVMSTLLGVAVSSLFPQLIYLTRKYIKLFIEMLLLNLLGWITQCIHYKEALLWQVNETR